MTEQDKRDKIIAAAYEVLSEKGYDRASTKEIARTAGVAQGLINYYFPGKDLLFAEVFRRETEAYCNSFAELNQFIGSGPLTLDLIRKMLELPKSRAISDPAWLRLRYELSAIGMRNENATPILKEMLDIKRKFISGIVESVSHLPREQSDTLASIIFSVLDGLGLQKITDPDFDSDQGFEMLAVMLSTYLAYTQNKRDS